MRSRGRPKWWVHYSRYAAKLRGRLWVVESEDGEPIRAYPIHRYDRAVAFADKLNHEEWESAMKAHRPRQMGIKKKVKKAA